MKNRIIASIMTIAMAASAASVLPTATASADWAEQNGNWYYYDEDGNMVKNEAIYDRDYEGWYYLGSDGAMVYDTIMYHFASDSDILCYYGSDGKLVTNKFQYIPLLDKYMLLDEIGGAVRDRLACTESGDCYYIADNSFSLSDTWAYDECNDQYYYFGSDGRMVKDNWVFDEGTAQWFYADSDGVIIEDDAYAAPDNCYVIPCFDCDDYIYDEEDTVVWVPELGKYVDESSHDSVYGDEDGNKYFFDIDGVSLKNTWLYTDMMSRDFNKGYYYFGDDCKMAVNTYIHDDATGHDFYVDENGRLVDDGSGIVPGDVYTSIIFG